MAVLSTVLHPWADETKLATNLCALLPGTWFVSQSLLMFEIQHTPICKLGTRAPTSSMSNAHAQLLVEPGFP